MQLQADASASLVALAGNTFLGSASALGSIVWAIDEVDAGRVAYAAATEVLHNEVTQCGLWDWLGATEGAAPRVLGTGNFQCDAQPWNGLGALADFTYSGSLPPEYVGDPAALRGDYDIVLFCTSNWGGPPEIDAQTYVDFVKVHGGGLYLATVKQFGQMDEIDRVNEIAEPLGAQFQADNLSWEDWPVAEFACFPATDGP